MNPEFKSNKMQWFFKEVAKWGQKNYSDYPWRDTSNPIHQLLVEILLQRTRAEQVIPVFRNIEKTLSTIDDFLSLEYHDFESMLSTLGLRWRITYLLRLFETLQMQYSGLIPLDYDILTSLPGVGPYTASAFLSLHQNIRKPIIDANIVRLYGRFFGFSFNGETRRKKWLHHLADDLTPQKDFKHYNYAILDLSRVLCKRRPICMDCPLQSKCSELTR
jgi:A/G-specific adenine glycosylase